MSDSPFVPFYTSDFLAGTSGMTAATKGVYITLLSLMYEAEAPLPQSWETLARRCGCTKSSFRKAIETLEDDAKIHVTDAGIWSEKCDKHIAQRRERSDSAKAAAKKRWEKEQQKQGSGDATASSAQCKPEPYPEPKSKGDTNVSPKVVGLSFSAFWDVWPNKTAKQAAERQWKKLSPDDREAAVASAPSWFSAWRNSHPEASPIHPGTYLYNKRWKDEAFISRQAPAPVETYSQQTMRMIREEEDAERQASDFRCVPGFDEPKVLQFAGATR